MERDRGSNQMQRAERSTPQSERTRMAILEAAERVFAEKGYAAVRLEDIAQQIGIRRASITYYFRDKGELCDAVLADIFGEPANRFQTASCSKASAPARIDALICVWVTSMCERPPAGRLLLREGAEASSPQGTASARHAATAIALVADLIHEGQRQQVFQPIDPIRVVSSMVGATICESTATPAVVPIRRSDLSSPGQPEALRDVPEMGRRLLGVRADGEPRADRREVG